jgi:hypothetical protein
MINYIEIATAHGISSEALEARVAAHGWDFSALSSSDPAAVEFCIRAVTSHAKQLEAAAALQAKRAASAAARQPKQTAAAIANPSSVCGKCDGTGKVWATWVANGICFQCKGVGALRCAA